MRVEKMTVQMRIKISADSEVTVIEGAPIIVCQAAGKVRQEQMTT